tara:strand:+ start:298 stop:600 length:303 start_codon:yes stop_codon:yes gene_type:complete
MKKITKATIKSFIKNNLNNMYIRNNSKFDGMVDGVTECGNGSFRKAEKSEKHNDYTLGVKEAWFVGSSNDYFTAYEYNGFKGYEVSNCCGNFILATRVGA